VLEDTPGALWSHGSIEASRLRSAPQMTRVVVAIDPAVTSGEEAGETGSAARTGRQRFEPFLFPSGSTARNGSFGNEGKPLGGGAAAR
jgi:hypothetical protein